MIQLLISFPPLSPLVFYQELTTLGFPSIYAESKGKELDLVSMVNRMNELLVLQHKNLRAQEEIEVQHRKLGSDMDHLQNCYSKLKVGNKIIPLKLCSSYLIFFLFLASTNLQLYFHEYLGDFGSNFFQMKMP